LLRPTIRKPGSELWFSWNPNSPQDPVDVLLRGEHPPRDAVVLEINWHDNPWLPAELLDEQEDDKRRDPDKWAHVWGGHYSLNSEARVFRNWTVEEFEAPSDAIHRLGADWGFAVDPTVLVRCHVQGRKLFVDYEAWQVGCEIDHLPKLFDTIEGSRKFLIRADSARPETVSYMVRQGYKILPAIKGPGSIEDGVEFLRSFDIVVHPRCAKVINELTLYAYKVDEHTGEILPVLDDKNNHTIDALRYALEELRKSGYKPAAQTNNQSWDGPHRPSWRKPREGGSWKTA
jgi:phage terminase large subunit